MYLTLSREAFFRSIGLSRTIWETGDCREKQDKAEWSAMCCPLFHPMCYQTPGVRADRAHAEMNIDNV